MRGIKSTDLIAILDFLNYGETNVYQQNLEAFLVKGTYWESWRNPAKCIYWVSFKIKQPHKHHQSLVIPINKPSIQAVEIYEAPIDQKVSAQMKDIDEQIKLIMTSTNEENSLQCLWKGRTMNNCKRSYWSKSHRGCLSLLRENRARHRLRVHKASQDHID